MTENQQNQPAANVSDQPASSTPPAAPAPTPAPALAGKPLIGYDDFAKLDLRVGKVLEVANHPSADKLFVLKVDLGGGEPPRQILAGLRPFMPPEALLGRQVVVVANLEPRKMRGLESHGMLLAAGFEDGTDRKVVFVTLEQDVPPGAAVS